MGKKVQSDITNIDVNKLTYTGNAYTLGELKKEKASKPFFVFLVLALFISLLYFMPDIQEYFTEGSGSIVDIYNDTIGKLIPREEKEFTFNRDLTKKKKDTMISLDDITITNIVIESDKIIYSISSTNEKNLDEANYYLEVYDQNQSKINEIKLSGIVSSEPLIKMNELSFPSSLVYYVKLISR